MDTSQLVYNLCPLKIQNEWQASLEVIFFVLYVLCVNSRLYVSICYFSHIHGVRTRYWYSIQMIGDQPLTRLSYIR